MILKLLLVLTVIAIVYFMFFKKKPLKNSTSHKKSAKSKEPVESNDMVECSTCGIYSELDESILSSGKYYCSDECLDQVK